MKSANKIFNAAALGLAFSLVTAPALVCAQSPGPLLRVTPAGNVGIGAQPTQNLTELPADANLTGCVRVNGVPLPGAIGCNGGLRILAPVPASRSVEVTPPPSPAAQATPAAQVAIATPVPMPNVTPTALAAMIQTGAASKPATSLGRPPFGTVGTAAETPVLAQATASKENAALHQEIETLKSMLNQLLKPR